MGRERPGCYERKYGDKQPELHEGAFRFLPAMAPCQMPSAAGRVRINHSGYWRGVANSCWHGPVAGALQEPRVNLLPTLRAQVLTMNSMIEGRRAIETARLRSERTAQLEADRS